MCQPQGWLDRNVPAEPAESSRPRPVTAAGWQTGARSWLGNGTPRRLRWPGWPVGLTLAWAGLLVLSLARLETPAAEGDAPSAIAGDGLAAHAFTALGSPAQRKVNVEWNRFYDSAGLATILRRLHEAFPQLTRLYALGQSVQGRPLWCLEVTAPQGPCPAARKPGVLAVANIHGNEVQGGEAIAYTAWYLCHQYGQLPAVTELLDHYVFYLVPTINPDSRDYWLQQPGTPSNRRSGVAPVDDDHDGLLDEDDVDDLDGDGAITQMRIKDPFGRWKPHPEFPEFLMVQVPPDQLGEYTLLGSEGLDNDGDGRVNEDPVGGYDMNRNWGWDWQPDFVQHGAHEYPFSLPETRAVAEFALAHPNLAAFISFHNAGGMILRGPGREGGMMQPADDRLLQFIATQGQKILPFYRSMLLWKELYTVWGGELDWFYGTRGVLSFVNEIWSRRSVDKGPTPPSPETEATFLKHVLLGQGLVPWHPFNHPTYGLIEIGGTRKEWGRTPVSFLLEEECHRNMAFLLYFASQMPRLRVPEPVIESLGPGLFKVSVTVENLRLIPTRTAQDVQNRISPPDIISLTGPDLQVVSSGRVTDRFFKRVEPVKRRPERVEVDAIPGTGQVQVQFIVRGRGQYTIRVDSAKGGLFERTGQLP